MGFMLVRNRPTGSFFKDRIGDIGRRSPGRKILRQELFAVGIDQTRQSPHHTARAVEFGFGGSDPDLHELHIHQFSAGFIGHRETIARHPAGEHIVLINHATATGSDDHGRRPDEESGFARIFFPCIESHHSRQMLA